MCFLLANNKAIRKNNIKPEGCLFPSGVTKITKQTYLLNQNTHLYQA